MIVQTADRIRELREKNDMTQSELAKRLSITRSSVNAWEMSLSIPSSKILPELCKVLHTTSDYLLGMDDTELLSLKYYSDDEREILYRLMRYFDESKEKREYEKISVNKILL